MLEKRINMTIKIILTIGFLLFISEMSFSQDSATVTTGEIKIKMITNRPGFTEASRAVFHKGFQIETGFQYSKIPKIKGSSEYSSNLLVPNLGLLYGISKNVEIRGFINYEGNKFISTGLESGYAYDFNSLILGAKINLTDAKGAIPEMALVLQQVFPTSSPDFEKWSSVAMLAWSYGLPANFGLSGNIIYTLDFGTGNHAPISNPHNLGYTLNLGYSITEKLGTYAELYGNNTFGNGDKLNVNLTGGFMYRINPKFQVDLIGGYGFETGSTLVNVGFSWLILK